MSLLAYLQAAGIELRPAVEVYREQALREGSGYIEHPHVCRGCQHVVDAKKLDEHETVCPNPQRMRAYRDRKSQDAHRRWHVRRNIVKLGCRWCERDRARR